MNPKFTLLISLLIISTFLSAKNENIGSSGFAFLKMYYSARSAGMANAFTALSDDPDAVFFNTAGLVKAENKLLKTTYLNYINGMQGGAITYSSNIDEVWHFAPFIQFLVSDDIDETIEDYEGAFGGKIGTFNTANFVMGVGFARQLHEVVDFGINAKFFYDKLYQNNTATGLIADVSILHQTNNPNLKIGASLKNFGTQLSYYTSSEYKEKFPITAVAGASYKCLDKGFINFDLCRPFDSDFYGKLGLEYYFNSYLTMRTGLDTRMEDYKTSESIDWMSGIAFGIGINWNKYIVDYALSSMGNLGFVNQISVSYRF